MTDSQPVAFPPALADLAAVTERLAAAGCVAADEEAGELLTAAGGDPGRLEALVSRREGGEPLAWITGWVAFGPTRVQVEAGVYVPRAQTAALAERAAKLLPPNGLAVDLCTGSGAIAVAIGNSRPDARVVGTDIDPLACRCAAANGVEVYEGHLADPLPAAVAGACDVVVGVVPYVPTDAIEYLPRDARDHEPRLALDGGPSGVRLLVAAVRAAGALLRPGGTLLLELGGDQDRELAEPLAAAGFGTARRHVDEDGDLRGLEARRLTGRGRRR
ncbi:hypothetical protein K6U06_06320 [Acidiferrimicrobium sp. IK]|uniref:N5-glutamine methyltransferase family protein n=1 Tax=Acidiferrimicrobium sp. IK TaxID=2871700 RepID=UPI0021CB6B6B|nr:hypothetical protein [Acidiferrimicrobium sp. IK]MCU4183967.1 hypothetical protein [Acidiferrimicrobium sp. IK]